MKRSDPKPNGQGDGAIPKTVNGEIPAKRAVVRRLLLLGAVCALGLFFSFGWKTWKRHRVAELALERAEVPVPKSGEFRERLAAAHQRALRLWRPEDGLADVANLSFANGNLESALVLYRALGRLEPKEPRWQHLSGTLLSGMGNLDEAEPYLRRAVELAPDYVPARIRFADALAKSGRGSEAATEYQRALELQPGAPFALLGLARLDVQQEAWARARARLREILVSEPGFQAAWSLLPAVNERLGLAPEVPARGDSAAANNQREMADPWADELADLCFDPYRLDVLADTAKTAGDEARAVRLYERAVAVAPDSAAAHRILGTYLLKSRQPEKARSVLERAVALDPSDSGNWTRLILALNMVGDSQALAKTLVDGLAHCPESPGLHLERARKLAEAGDLDGSLQEFALSRKLRPEEPQAYLDAAMLCFRAKRQAAGLAIMKELLVVNPTQPVALLHVGHEAITEGDEKLARDCFGRLRSDTTVPTALRQKYRDDFEARFNSRL